MVMREKLTWLLLVQPLAFLRIQDGGLRHLEFRPIFKFWSRWHRGSCNTSFWGFSRTGNPFLGLICGCMVGIRVKPATKRLNLT